MIHLDPDSADLAGVTRALLDRHGGLDELRSRLEGRVAHRPEMWQHLVGAGLVAALAPEELGGAGLRPAHLARVLEQMGEHLLPEPYLETAVIAVPLLSAFPGSPIARQWLTKVIAGEAVVTVRLGALTPYVAQAASAHLLLDVADDGAVTAYPRGRFEQTTVTGVDELTELARVRLGDGHELGCSPADAEQARVLAVGGAACMLAGVLHRLLRTTVDYIGVREQFGRPVGSFQAVKHKAAGMAVATEMAAAAALTSLEDVTAPDAFIRAAAAKAYASDAAELVNVDALQLHGGIGFTWEHDLHLGLKRAMSLSAAYGSPRLLRRAMARDLLARQDPGATIARVAQQEHAS